MPSSWNWRTAGQPPENVEIEEAHHSFPVTSEGDGGRASGGGTFAVGGTKEFENLC